MFTKFVSPRYFGLPEVIMLWSMAFDNIQTGGLETFVLVLHSTTDFAPR